MAPLTQRDKKLLGFLAIVLVLFVFIRLLIMPQMEQYFDLDTEIELAELEKHEMNLKIVSVEGTKKRNEELKEELLDASEAYYPMLSSQEIDREITGIFLKFGGNIENLSITMPSGPSDLKMYVGWQGISGETPVQDGTGAAEKIAQEQIDSGNARVQDKTDAAGKTMQNQVNLPKDVVQDQVYAADVVVKCTGTRAQMTEMIDFITCGNPAIFVTGYSFTAQRASKKSGGAKEQQEELTIGLQLFMCENGGANLE